MVTLNINGQARRVDAPPDMPLLWALRDVVGLTGTKSGCGMALCGACTVHLEGQPIRSCVTPAVAMAHKRITTIEAIGQTPASRKVQAVWLDLGCHDREGERLRLHGLRAALNGEGFAWPVTD